MSSQDPELHSLSADQNNNTTHVSNNNNPNHHLANRLESVSIRAPHQNQDQNQNQEPANQANHQNQTQNSENQSNSQTQIPKITLSTQNSNNSNQSNSYNHHHHHSLSVSNPPSQSRNNSNLFNETAATLYQNNFLEYQKSVHHNIEQTRIELNSIPTITDDIFEPNYSEITEEIFQIQKNKMMCAGEKQKLTGWQAQNAQTSGHSFIQPGTIRPFSKK